MFILSCLSEGKTMTIQKHHSVLHTSVFGYFLLHWLTEQVWNQAAKAARMIKACRDWQDDIHLSPNLFWTYLYTEWSQYSICTLLKDQHTHSPEVLTTNACCCRLLQTTGLDLAHSGRWQKEKKKKSCWWDAANIVLLNRLFFFFFQLTELPGYTVRLQPG